MNRKIKIDFKTNSNFIDRIFALTQDIYDRSPFRITGTKSCLDAGEAVRDLYSKHCHNSMVERFALYPGQLFNIGRILSVSYIVSIILMLAWSKAAYLSSFILLAGAVYGTSHFFMYKGPFDRLFKKKKAQNAVGIIEPQNDVKRQMIIVGHYDSPYVSRFLSGNQMIYGIHMISSILFYVSVLLISLYLSISYLISGSTEISPVFTAIIFIGMIPEAFLFFFISKEPSPGIGDNLIGSVITAGIAELFSVNDRCEGLRLQNTRLVLLSTDAEEAGQRGAKAYISNHRKDIAGMPTHVLNIDSIYSPDDLTLLTRDRNSLTAMSLHVIEKYEEICRRIGIIIKRKGIPPGGGGTDGAWFKRCGADTADLIGMSMDLSKKKIYYHTAEDTIGRIDPEAVKAVIEIAVNYILDIDWI